MPVPMLDLKRQYAPLHDELLAALDRVLSDPALGRNPAQREVAAVLLVKAVEVS